MAQLIIDNLEDEVRETLLTLARDHGRSVEEEVRGILREAVAAQRAAGAGLGSRIAARFANCGLDAEIPELRGHLLVPPSFEP